MKVAIIGAGLSGIVCALQLMKQGIKPDVFERNDHVAEPYRHVGASLEIVFRPIKDPLDYLHQNYGIQLKSSGKLKKIVHESPSASAIITGDLGYFIHRGAIATSIELELAKNLNCGMFFNKEVDFEELKADYDYVIVASGHPTEARKRGIWREVMKMAIKGTVITGDFETDTFMVWLNKNYCRSGYAYLAPFSNKEASLIIAVPGVGLDEIDKYWDMFVRTEKLDYKIIECFKRTHYSGFVYPHRVGNTFFIGNAGGCLDPMLGFGVFPSVITASEAAKAIVFGTDYEAGIKSVVSLNKKLLEFRKFFNKLDNKDYDRLVRLIGLPGVNSMVYNTRLNVVKMAHAALKPINALLIIRKKFNK